MQKPTKKYIVKSSAAVMPSSCWGRYRRIAVLEVDPDVESVTMISTHARGVREIVRTWEKLNVGTTNRCAYAKAMEEAEELCAELNWDTGWTAWACGYRAEVEVSL